MVKACVMPKQPPEGIAQDELYEVVTTRVRDPAKRAFGTYLSREAHRIIGRVSKKYGVNKAHAVEIVLRQWRERFDQ